MIFCKRPPAPEFLTAVKQRNPHKGDTNEIAWGKQYAEKLINSKKANDFVWSKYNGKRVNMLLEPELREMTKNHCAFCDICPLWQSGGTIEHFKPTSKYPLESHKWENLFYCCNNCNNNKRERFDPVLLKPDIVGYAFEDYFICKTEGLSIFLHPNPRMPEVNQERARITIELYGLNGFGRPEQRYREVRKYDSSANQDIEDFPYRYLFS